MSNIQDPAFDGANLIWGAKAIAKFIGRSEKSTFRMLEEGKIHGAKQFGRSWSFRPAVFLASYDAVAA